MEEPNYRKLVVWQKAHSNALSTINLLNKCNSKYARIMIQCVNSATSIGANIAEGNASFTKKEKERYFKIALNSSYEFDNWIQILKDSGSICSDKKCLRLLESQNIEVIKILTKIIRNLSS